MPKDRIMGARASYTDFEGAEKKRKAAPAPPMASGKGGRPAPAPDPRGPRAPKGNPNDRTTKPGTRGQQNVGPDGEDLTPKADPSKNRGQRSG
jgi:hypothetical protein